VRAWLLAAGMGLDRAYLFFFNDDDQPQLHGSSGLTRNFVPKPSYHAGAWLQKSLGDYRFTGSLRDESFGVYAYEFIHGSDATQRVIAVWKPSGPDAGTTLPMWANQIVRTERMPLSDKAPEAVPFGAAGAVTTIAAGESPVLLWVKSAR
jgi:hypothetical protein